MIQAWSLSVYGRVQGVGFRYSARNEAVRLNLAGWVRNDWDGSVKIFVQGQEELLEIFLKWLSQGPPMSYVQEVRKKRAAPDPGQQDFRIIC